MTNFTDALKDLVRKAKGAKGTASIVAEDDLAEFLIPHAEDIVALVEALKPIEEYGAQIAHHRGSDRIVIELWGKQITYGDIIAVHDAISRLDGGKP